MKAATACCSRPLMSRAFATLTLALTLTLTLTRTQNPDRYSRPSKADAVPITSTLPRRHAVCRWVRTATCA